jgi:hypothetical protein
VEDKVKGAQRFRDLKNAQLAIENYWKFLRKKMNMDAESQETKTSTKDATCGPNVPTGQPTTLLQEFGTEKGPLLSILDIQEKPIPTAGVPEGSLLQSLSNAFYSIAQWVVSFGKGSWHEENKTKADDPGSVSNQRMQTAQQDRDNGPSTFSGYLSSWWAKYWLWAEPEMNVEAQKKDSGHEVVAVSAAFGCGVVDFLA